MCQALPRYKDLVITKTDKSLLTFYHENITQKSNAYFKITFRDNKGYAANKPR